MSKDLEKVKITIAELDDLEEVHETKSELESELEEYNDSYSDEEVENIDFEEEFDEDNIVNEEKEENEEENEEDKKSYDGITETGEFKDTKDMRVINEISENWIKEWDAKNSKYRLYNKVTKEYKEYIEEDSEESEEEDYSDSDDESIRKLEHSLEKNKLLLYHPEVKQINYNELMVLNKIVKDVNGNPIDPLHKTLPILTKYEKSRVLGLRAKQINSGADIFINIHDSIIDGYTIALMELEEKRIPFIIRRPIPNGTSEYWNLSDLELC